MNSQIVLGIIFLILTVAPIVYFGKVAKNRSLRAKQKLTSYANEQAITLTEIEHWNDKSIGISMELRKLLFVNLDSRNSHTQLIDLTNFRKCTVNVKKQTIDLVLEPRKTSGTTFQHIELYNDAYDSPNEVGFHHQKAIKWAKTIQQVLNQKPTPLRKTA